MKIIKRPVMIENPEVGPQYMYRVASQPILDKNAFADEIVRQGTTARKADVLAVLDNLGIAVSALLVQGNRIEIDGLGYISLVAKGVTDQEGVAINGNDIRIVPKFRFYKGLSDKVNANTPVSIVSYTAARPEPAELRDATTGKVNDILTSGSMVGLIGYGLRVNTTRSDEGVWLIPTDAVTDAVKISVFLDNKPARLSFMIPAELAVGTTCYLEVRNRQSNCKNLQLGRLGYMLTVA